MVLDELSKKYFKLAVKNKKSESPNRIVCNCVMCGDKKNRLSLSAVDDDVGVCRCFNAGCTLNDQALPLPMFLKLIDNSLYERYRREKFNKILGKEKDLNSLLGNKTKEKNKKIIKKSFPISSEKIMEIFSGLERLESIESAVKYVENRGISKEIYENWYFSPNKFIKIFDKSYYVEDFIFIPIIQNNKLSGFYTRSIREKRFSTILFPNKEKFWSSDFILNKENQYYIFEGIFDALSTGLEHIIAMLSADLSNEILEEVKNPIFVLDNDETGVLKSLRYVESGYSVFVWPNDIYEKDMNELLRRKSRKDIKSMIEDNIFSGMDAQIRLKIKKN